MKAYFKYLWRFLEIQEINIHKGLCDLPISRVKELRKKKN
jgi:hypothetical protein